LIFNKSILNKNRLKTMVFKVLSYNIWFDNYKKTERTLNLIDEINQTSPDIICIQEITEDVLFTLNNKLNYYIYPKKINIYSNVILSKYKIIKCFTLDLISNQNRKINCIIIKVNNNLLCVVTTHYESEFNKTNLIKNNQYKYTNAILDKLYDTYKNVIFASDTNITVNDEQYFFKNIMWRDSWTTHNKTDGFTYDSKYNSYIKFKKQSIRARLDRIIYRCDNFVSSSSKLSISYFKKEISDHYGLYTTFKNIK
jgi:endonuclease/exonuclease/phosphatase family metal-dependent hydrolase